MDRFYVLYGVVVWCVWVDCGSVKVFVWGCDFNLMKVKVCDIKEFEFWCE